MAVNMNTSGMKKSRFKAAFTELMLTLIGGRKQRWKNLRQLALAESEQQEKRG